MKDPKNYNFYHKHRYSIRKRACDVLFVQTSYDQEMDIWIKELRIVASRIMVL